MILDNQTMIAALDASDRARYYHWCTDLSLAGEDYKVNEIVCFVCDASDPLADFIQVKKYDIGFLLLLVYTENQNLIAECMDYVDMVKDAFEEIELRTPYESVLQEPQIMQRFSLTEPEYPGSPVYYLHTVDELSSLSYHTDAAISPYRESDKDDIAQAIAAGALDSEYMNADMFVPCSVFSDVKWYILRVNGELAGYLRAECGYANIYDIGWLYVEPRFRGHGYACDLVMYFSHDMFAHGQIPHYGYAISEQSARVAQKCGYVCDPTRLYSYRLLPRNK
jgi:GNAT superfamily N-acetyltransferase